MQEFFSFLQQICHVSQSPPPFPLVQHSAAASVKGLISTDGPDTLLQQHSWGPVGGGSFLLQPILNLSWFYHFHSHLENFMDGLPEAMKIIVNKPWRRKQRYLEMAQKSSPSFHGCCGQDEWVVGGRGTALTISPQSPLKGLQLGFRHCRQSLLNAYFFLSKCSRVYSTFSKTSTTKKIWRTSWTVTLF